MASYPAPPILVECDVSDDANVASAFDALSSDMDGIDIIVHSIAFANREDLGGPFIDTPREGFRLALDISAYSLVSVARHAAPMMKGRGGSIITMTFQASNRVFPGYKRYGAPPRPLLKTRSANSPGTLAETTFASTPSAPVPLTPSHPASSVDTET